VRGAFARVPNALRERNVATSVELMTTDDDAPLCRYIPYSRPFDACVRGRRENVLGLVNQSPGRDSHSLQRVWPGLFVDERQWRGKVYIIRYPISRSENNITTELYSRLFTIRCDTFLMRSKTAGLIDCKEQSRN